MQYLFTVNPGSNTVSFFVIDHNDPLHPRLVGEPAGTLGEFPISVTYSSSLKTGTRHLFPSLQLPPH